jgi:hypothetical protein
VIDAMTLAEAGEIFAHWAESPPAHLMLQTIAAMLGWKPRQGRDHTAGPADLAASPPPGLAIVQGADPALPEPILDIAALREINRARADAAAGGRRDESKE